LILAKRPLSRRDWLRWSGTLLGASLWPSRGWAIGPKSRFHFVQLLYDGGNYLPRPTALRRLAWEVDKRTSIEVNLEPKEVRLSDQMLFHYPFLFLNGDKAFTPLPASDIERLHRFLIYGGFLLIDSADPRADSGFDKSVRQLMRSLFPSLPLKKLKPEHTVYKSFYLLNRPVGRVASVPYLEGVEQDGRTMVLYSQNDLSGAWARDNFGQWEFGVYPGGQRQRELAIRWGINIIMYILCIDYKADQVHIPFILKRRRWHVD
jgi:hypothetical protein